MATPYEKVIRQIKTIMHGIDEEVHNFDSPVMVDVSDQKYDRAATAISQLAAICRDLEEIENWRRHSASR